MWVWARGASKKIRDPLLISATVEAKNFKFCIQLGFAEYVTITASIPNVVTAGWSTGASQKLCEQVPLYQYPVSPNSCRNVIKLQI